MSNVNNNPAENKANEILAQMAQTDPETRAALVQLAARLAPSFPSAPPSPFPGNGLLVPPTPPISATAVPFPSGASDPPPLPTLHEFGQLQGDGVASTPRPSHHIPRKKDPDFDQIVTTLTTLMHHIDSFSVREAEKLEGIVSSKAKLELHKAEHVNAAADAHRRLKEYERLAQQERANNEAHNYSAKQTQQQIDQQAELEEKAYAAYYENQKATRNLKFLRDMYEEMNDKGPQALVGVPILNLLKMTEHQYRDNFQHQPLTKGSQLLALGEEELRNMVGNFIRWGINNNATTLQALNNNPIAERTSRACSTWL